MRKSLGAGGLLVAFGLVLQCGESPSAGNASPALLRQALGRLRLSDGRLTGGIQDHPAQVRSPPSRAALRAVTRAAEEIENGEPGAGSLHTLGILRLAEGRFRDAILTLEEVAGQDPGKATTLSDLAAAYLFRGQREGLPYDYIRALNAADQALALQPDLPEALYNRAEALTLLQLARGAEAAWNVYLDADRTSPWAEQARRHFNELAEPNLSTAWKLQRPGMEAALVRGNMAAIGRFVSRFPDLARQWAEEELLSAWGGSADVRLPQGLEPLAAARRIGVALREQIGDAMVADSVAVILQAQKEGDETRLAALRQGHRLFRQGLLSTRRQDFENARPVLTAAGGALVAARSPFAAWAELRIAICDSYRDPEAARARLLPLVTGERAARYPSLTGRVEWMLGTVEAILNHPEKNLAWSRLAVEHLDRSSAGSASGVVSTQLADAYRDLGQPDRSWKARLAALAALRRLGEPGHLHAVLWETLEDLLNQGQAGAALAFADECLENATVYKNPTALAESRRQRGRALALLGRLDEAQAELRASREEAAAIPPGDVRRRALTAVEEAEAELLADRDPQMAIHSFSRALALRQEARYSFRLPLLYTARARAYRNLGDSAAEETDLRLAIEQYEKVREGIEDETLRASSFEQVQEPFEQMVRLQIKRGDELAALSFAERARSRLLLDLVMGRNAGAKPLRLPRALPAKTIASRWPEGTTLVEFFVLSDRLLAWIVRRGEVRLIQTDVRETDLERAVAAFQAAIARRAPEGDIRRVSARLAEWLIQPLQAELPAGSPIVFVPDRLLAQVPFAALFDRRRGRYLMEDHALALAPSATLYLAAIERRARLAPVPADALAVGDPAFDPVRFKLQRLHAAAAEAVEISALYPKSARLLGEDATRSAFLAAAPNYRIVHFAGHSLLNSASPELSSLIFAPAGDDPGVLYARDLASLRLPGTELVVLSACRTLDGAAASREGLVGLAAAFLAAGAPIVVSSLWKVDDEPTRELMLAFHRELHRGADPAVALREAQRRLLADPGGRYRSPSAWAGFETLGGVLAAEK